MQFFNFFFILKIHGFKKVQLQIHYYLHAKLSMIKHVLSLHAVIV